MTRAGTSSTSADAGRASMPRRTLLLASGASFVSFLDVTITNLAIPDVHRDFPGSLSSLSWIVTAYTVLFAALLAPAGRLADVIGRRALFITGTAVFTAASLVAACAPSLSVLLAARAVQGVGGALVMPASLAFALMDTPPARRLAAIGIWSAAASAAAALGPALGGVLVEAWGWRSLFVINVPLGAILVWGAVRLRLAPTPASHRRLPDPVGAVGLIVAVGGVALGLAQGQTWGWGSVSTVGCLAAGAGAFALTVVRSRRHDNPAIEVALWRSRSYAAANIVSVLFGAVLYALLLAGVLLLVTSWHYSELKAGLAMTPGAVLSTVVGLSLGRMRRKPAPKTLVAFGALAIAASTVAVALWVGRTPHFLALWLPSGLVLGLGIGATSVGVSSAAALSAPPTSFASATGLNIAARQVGGAVGLAALAASLASASGPADLTPFRLIYWLGAAACLLIAVCSASLVLRPVAPAQRLEPVDAGSR